MASKNVLNNLLKMATLGGMAGFLFHFFSGLCGGKAMVAYTKPQHTKKEESEQLRG